MTVAVYTPTRHPGIAVSYYSVARQEPPVDHWLVADQLLGKRSDAYEFMRAQSPNLNIEAYQAEILENKNGNLEHVSNWALRRARELEVDLLVFLQDFIWAPPTGVSSFLKAAAYHPFDLLTGNCAHSKGPKWAPLDKKFEQEYNWNIFATNGVAAEKPFPPYDVDTRETMGWNKNLGDSAAAGCYLTNHAWEINWGALPHALINCGVDFDEDYDYGTQWGNTQFSFDVNRKMNEPPTGSNARGGYVPRRGSVWWDYNNRAIGMPHREYFPAAHAGERDLDNGWRFWEKNPELVGIA